MERRSRLFGFFCDPTFISVARKKFPKGLFWYGRYRWTRIEWTFPTVLVVFCPLAPFGHRGGVKVESSLFGGKINFFRPLAVRPWVPKVEFFTVLGQSFQTKKTASRYDDE